MGVFERGEEGMCVCESVCVCVCESVGVFVCVCALVAFCKWVE